MMLLGAGPGRPGGGPAGGHGGIGNRYGSSMMWRDGEVLALRRDWGPAGRTSGRAHTMACPPVPSTRSRAETSRRTPSPTEGIPVMAS